jgi:hypothetical protein
MYADLCRDFSVELWLLILQEAWHNLWAANQHFIVMPCICFDIINWCYTTSVAQKMLHFLVTLHFERYSLLEFCVIEFDAQTATTLHYSLHKNEMVWRPSLDKNMVYLFESNQWQARD